MKVDYTSLTGGLDLVSGAVSVRPGRVSECLNFEEVFGKVGYRRVDGYERFDGRSQPHKATFAVLEFNNGSVEATPGNVLTSAGVEAGLLSIHVNTGSWATGDAAGYMVIAEGSGVWVPGMNIYRSGVLSATATSGAIPGKTHPWTSESVEFYMRESSTLRRAYIQPVPGDGPILGVAVFRDVVYAARNSEDNASSSIWRSTLTGWASIKDGLLPGGRYDFEVANFSGDSRETALYGVDGRNPPFKWDGFTFVQFGTGMGSHGTSTSSNSVGLGSKAFTITEPTRSWAPGDVLLVTGPNSKNRMTGTVTSYSGVTLDLNVTAINGSGTYTNWLISKSNFEDKPYLIASHKDHLFLAYPRGQLQTSNVGDPMAFTTTSSLFGVGEEITGMTALKGSVFGIFCDNKVSLLEGSNKSDWQLSQHAKDIGTKLHTLQESGGNALMLGTRGFTSLQATQSFGGFEPAIFSRDVKPLLDSLLQDVICTRMVRGKYQYRIYFRNNIVLTATILTPNPVISPKDVSFMSQEYAHQVVCVGSGIYEEEDSMFFGTEDGYVMREDVGNSFDGETIDSVLRLHFNHLKNPVSKKRYHKLTVEMESKDAADINFRQIFDYSDGNYPVSVNRQAITEDLGGQWNVSQWNNFAWSLPIATQAEANIEGVSRNMSLLLWTSTDYDSPIILQGLILQYSILGLTR